MDPNGLVRKWRAISYPTKVWYDYGTTGSSSNASGYHTVGNTQFQVMESRYQPSWRVLINVHGGRLDVGGPFLSHKVSMKLNRRPFQLLNITGSTSGEIRTWYNGEFVTHNSISSLLRRAPHGSSSTQEKDWIKTQTPTADSDASLDALGAVAISRVKPTNPIVDLSVTLAELRREGLPHLPGTGSANLGDQYLNYQFGIAPLISDGQDLLTAIRGSESIIDQYLRDSGRLVRRSYEFPESRTSSVTVENFRVPPPLTPTGGSASGLIVGLGKVEIRETLVRKVWFDGAFTYYLPRSAFGRRLSELDKLYGVKPGIDTAWNLTPWSWLADYFTNAGEVISNLNSFMNDGLVMPYGYLMCHTLRTREFTWTGPFKIGGVWTTVSFTDVREDEVKQRQRANPYGFGVLDSDLTGRQLSILAALGISRL